MHEIFQRRKFKKVLYNSPNIKFVNRVQNIQFIKGWTEIFMFKYNKL